MIHTSDWRGKAIWTMLIALIFLSLFISVSGKKIEVTLEDNASIEVNKVVEDAKANNLSYAINVTNTGKILLRDVKVVDLFPPAMKYLDSYYPNSNEVLIIELLKNNEDGTIKEIVWFLGDLQTGQSKSILVTVSKINPSQSISANQATAKGKAFDELVVSNATAQYKSLYINDSSIRSINISNSSMQNID
jgi:hypothetical protein